MNTCLRVLAMFSASSCGAAVASLLLIEVAIGRNPGGTWRDPGSYPQLLLLCVGVAVMAATILFAALGVPLAILGNTESIKKRPWSTLLLAMGLPIVLSALIGSVYGREHYLSCQAGSLIAGVVVTGAVYDAFLQRRK